MAVNKTIQYGLLLVFLTAVISGFSIFINSFAIKGFDSSVFTFAKNIVVAILLFAVIFAVKEYQSIKNLTQKQWMNLAAIGLIGGSIPFLLFFKGLQMTTGTTASFIHKILFAFSTILAVTLLREKLDKKMVFGAILVLAGTYFMIRPDFKFSIGEIFILVAVIFWAFENILAKKVLSELSGNVVAWGRMFFGSIFIFAYLLITGKQGIIFSMNSGQYFWVIISAILLLLYVMTYYNGLKILRVSTSTAILSIGAPITSILSWAFGSGALSIYDCLGMLMMIGGAIVIAFYEINNSKSMFSLEL